MKETEWRRVSYVSVGNETNANSESDDCDLPKGNFFLGSGSLSSAPRSVHTSPDTDGISDIVCSVGERGSAGSDNLDEGVQVLNFILVLDGLSGG